MATILENVQGVKARIAHAARAAGRDPESVTLLAVSKTHAVARLAEAQAAGLHAFGENYVQEALRKMQSLSAGVEWHLIGALQSNKSRLAAERFDWVQTVDRVRIANRLSEQRPDHLPPLNVLIEVNISGEANKSGVAVKEVTGLGAAIARLPRLRLRGLMAIPSPGATGDFEKMRQLYDNLRAQFGFDTLSMGMSDDMDQAIAAGATMVRIGTAIFGARKPEETTA
ncbi:MAG TPA: YggS family pyridoxal phosphate-dependent enzyme [Burkholderiales bacterium]|jgi:pyridoxal phosphate enzyme (YggS family)|nr:YggS family pyridoxal phosphate-dependent enzyme [Burkholderiales bacterium]